MPRVTTQIPHRRKRPMRSSPVTGPDRFPLLEKRSGEKLGREFPAADPDGLQPGTRGFLPSSLRIAVHRAFVFVIAMRPEAGTRCYYSTEAGLWQGAARFSASRQKAASHSGRDAMAGSR